MFCGKCGKRVHDDMLFCPFCGSPIVIPDQEESDRRAPAPNPVPAAKAESEPARIEKPAMQPAPSEEPVQASETEFVPLRYSFDSPEEPVPNRNQPSADSPEPSLQPPRKSDRSPRSRTRNTYVPLRDVDPNNLFMDDPDEDDFDSDDLDAEESYDFEEKEQGSFLHRHMRGFVAMILLAAALLVCVAWASSGSGQLALAKLNLAWKAEPYARLGYEAYNAQDYTLAAKNYSRAIALEENNYEYAHSAMVAEYMADHLDAATVMAKKCIELNPDSVEPYMELKKIYTGKDLPWDVRELLKQGYERTGDAQLKVE